MAWRGGEGQTPKGEVQPGVVSFGGRKAPGKGVLAVLFRNKVHTRPVAERRGCLANRKTGDLQTASASCCWRRSGDRRHIVV